LGPISTNNAATFEVLCAVVELMLTACFYNVINVAKEGLLHIV